MPKKEMGQTTYVCYQCNEHFTSLTQFYKSYSDLYARTGYLPICKNCLGELFDSYVEKYRDVRKAMQRICMAFDLYYSDSIFDTCNDGTSAILGNYIRRLNMKQYKGKTFNNTLDEGFEFNKASTSKKKNVPEVQEQDEQEVDEIDPADIEKWGIGFENVDYGILNSHYRLLKTANPNCDSNQEIFITDLCYTKMQQMKAVREGRVDDYNKLTDSYRKSFTQAGLKTVRDSSINEEFTIGVNAETIEKYTPAEYYKNKELYHDFDNIGNYINRFLLRPLRNLMHGTKDRDYEYFVKDEENEDVYQEEE